MINYSHMNSSLISPLSDVFQELPVLALHVANTHVAIINKRLEYACTSLHGG